jgi:16S rRNA (guanine966-N2)-methyltransferase
LVTVALVRIVAGTVGGRRLQAPAGKSTRPTSDRVREAMFSMIASRVDLDHITVVDLFAGSGALGIEALSRGAGRVTFVDSDRRAVAAIRANLEELGFAGERAAVVTADALEWVRRGPPPADLVLADPPYSYGSWPSLLAALQGLAPLAVLETGGDLLLTPGWSSVRRRRYGASVVTIAEPAGWPDVAEHPPKQPKGEK